ncbi:protein of unknown function [Singulisphaera sp. GP187]|uniref:galactose oxidase early set domain-containing protein n=1 Tax=Singulisphaera sp. GP187 TaxID=1882752 RepID=UPI0009264F88|nr:galactose oxidase early set domain-containing protein [Singulisphaera sp. GP187]SIO26828.1 protein of unknown function [Singulisphaera sp. GP187]
MSTSLQSPTMTRRLLRDHFPPWCTAATALWLATGVALADDDPARDTSRNASEPRSALLDVWGDRKEFGAWYVPPLPDPPDRMQAVHVTLLPSGKLLIVNGSGFRLNYCKECGMFKEGVDGTNYDVVNETALYEPLADLEDNLLLPKGNKAAFRRIASPATGRAALEKTVGGDPGEPEDADESRWANDLFCAGHLQMPDGNVLFVSGNRMNYPGMQFTGTKFSNIYDWKTDTWRDPQLLADGHWYPTVVGLGDGRMMTVSGLKYSKAVKNLNSSVVEFFDYRTRRWTSRDIAQLPNSPFNTLIGLQEDERDRLDHYPRMVPLADGRFLITGDGSGHGNPNSRRTYFMKIGPPARPNQAPEISFELGADRPSHRRMYSSGLMDPNSPNGDFLAIGGMLGTERTTIGTDFAPVTKAEAVTSGLERFRAPTAAAPLGGWDLVPRFLGDRPTDARVMHLATILPTRQFLVVGGGNFPFQRPVFEPQLFTADPTAPGGYRGKRLNPGTQPRLYHSTALLLPDGRVFVGGGNAVRAAIEIGEDGQPTEGKPVHLNTVRAPHDNSFTFVERGKFHTVAEIYQFEIFYPPYLFIDGPRPRIERAPTSIKYGASANLQVADFAAGAAGDSRSIVLIKLGAATHAFDFGQRLFNMPFHINEATGLVTVQAPTNRHLYPPGYYMLFCVSGAGKPSVARMVQLAGNPSD